MRMRIALSFVLVVITSGCAELRYRAATKDIAYHLGRDNFVSCWEKASRSTSEQCQDTEAIPDLEACARELSVSARSFLVENIRKEIQSCMKGRGWIVGDRGPILF